jgi:hypothetical protein
MLQWNGVSGRNDGCCRCRGWNDPQKDAGSGGGAWGSGENSVSRGVVRVHLIRLRYSSLIAACLILWKAHHQFVGHRAKVEEL